MLYVLVLHFLNYSSIETSWPYGLSPCGLPSNGYLGHTFWDQETWMYPPLLVFHQDLARSCLEYRFERMHSAAKRAKDEGYKGLQVNYNMLLLFLGHLTVNFKVAVVSWMSKKGCKDVASRQTVHAQKQV